MKFVMSLLSVLTLMYGLSQEDTLKDGNAMKQWSIGVGVGASDGHAPIRISGPRIYQPSMIQGDIRYMFNNRFGIMASMQYNTFKVNTSDLRTSYVNASLSGVLNAGELLKFNEFTNRLGLLIHGGFGISSMWQKDFFTNAGIENTQSPMFNKADDMLAYSFGATPQFKINENFSLNADLSFMFHGRQTRTFDFQHLNKRNGIDGYFLNLSVGASYYLGKGEKHADWTPTEFGGEEVDLSEYDKSIEALEKRLDALNDTTETVSDIDKDGIPDEYDLCPDSKGTWGNSGCPDSDGDDIPDHIDECPDVKGSWKNKGCPETEESVEKEADQNNTGTSTTTQTESNNNDNRSESTKSTSRKPMEFNGNNDKRYHVIVGAFKNVSYADRFVIKLKGSDFSNTEIIGKRYGLNYVGVGSYDDKNKALEMLQRARQNVIESAWIYDSE